MISKLACEPKPWVLLLAALLQIMFVLVAMSLILCGAALIYLLVRGENFKDALSFTIVLLVSPRHKPASANEEGGWLKQGIHQHSHPERARQPLLPCRRLYYRCLGTLLGPAGAAVYFAGRCMLLLLN
jgi:hypothetical protein